ncbi:MAG TPA: purine-nucleoside phosphorylase [Chthoniobacterales bacterium]|jgi:purine-nucleoside phosphorylase
MRSRDRQTSAIGKLRNYRAETAIILGSGLNSLVGETTNDQLIPYRGFGEIPQPTVLGHAGQFVLGEIEKTKVVFAQGRVHLYEGYSAREVASIVRVLAEAGIDQLILTNAAGALNTKFIPGQWMMITDHINLTGTSPLTGSPEFVDLSEAYSPRLREKFRNAARELARRSSSEGGIDMTLHEGVYAGTIGPQYETPAEVRRLQKLGADAVGMSTVLEVIQARALNLEVAAFSCLTNLAAGLSKEKVSHEQVLETGQKAAANFAKLLSGALSQNESPQSGERTRLACW